jgi:hypothetical protein
VKTANIVAILAFVLILGVVSSRIAVAGTVVRMSIPRMAQTATLIVRARCVGNAARWEGGEIWTITQVETEDVWKGAASSRLTIRLLGGSIGNITSTVSGVPRFHAGEDLVLFLEPTRLGDYSVESWEQGTFRIRRDVRSGHELVTQDTAISATFDPKTRTFESSGVRGVTLDAFRAQVVAVLSAEANGGAR